jgi:cyclopentanol dehydrogenase
MRLDNKVALISGGARGMGAVEAKLFCQEGAKVVFGDILDEDGRKVEAEIRELGGEATYVHLDVTQESDWQRAVETASSTYGKLDILVNNAGIAPRYETEDSLLAITEEDWDRVMGVNVKGVFLGVKFAIPLMRAAGGGSIVNISSGAGIAPSPETPASYSASKGAVRIFTKSVAVQYARENIRCNSVHPGPIDTPMLQSAQAGSEYRIERVPLGRIGTPEEIAYGVLYLASDEASFVTGSELIIDGGRTAQ